MLQLDKFHKERIEYRTVKLLFANDEISDYNDAPNLFNLNKIYPGEATNNTFLTRSFDLNLGDKNPYRIRIFNFSYKTPLFYNGNDADNESQINDFNQIILFNCDLFNEYGPIPISLNTNTKINFFENPNYDEYLIGSNSLNQLDFNFTPTKSINSINFFSFNAYNYIAGIHGSGFNTTALKLPLLSNAGTLRQKIFQLNFIVELYYNN